VEGRLLGRRLYASWLTKPSKARARSAKTGGSGGIQTRKTDRASNRQRENPNEEHEPTAARTNWTEPPTPKDHTCCPDLRAGFSAGTCGLEKHDAQQGIANRSAGKLIGCTLASGAQDRAGAGDPDLAHGPMLSKIPAGIARGQNENRARKNRDLSEKNER
jgi:hypothetical protein